MIVKSGKIHMLQPRVNGTIPDGPRPPCKIAAVIEGV
jgi:hypothetical protein